MTAHSEHYAGIPVVPYTDDFDPHTADLPLLVTDMPNDAYHALADVPSASGLKKVEVSPAHYRFCAPSEDTRAKQIGTAFHTALLEPERFADEYLLLEHVEDRRRSEYKEAIKSHPAEQVLVSKEAANLKSMQETVHATPLMHEILTGPGLREASLFVREPVTGVVVRVRFDLLTHRDGQPTCVDVKKCQDARPDVFSRAVHNYGYDLQAAFYKAAFEWASGESLRFDFAAIEEQPPHGHKLYTADPLMVEIGTRRFSQALDAFVECERSGIWPNLTCEEGELISVPGWAAAQYEDEIVESIV